MFCLFVCLFVCVLVCSFTVLFMLLPGTVSFLDFTCFINYPRININGNTDLFIGGYKSGADMDATVVFDRASNTGTGSGLPTGSQDKPHPSNSVSATQLLMPQSGGIQRIGAFTCKATKGGLTERITTIIMADNSKFVCLFAFFKKFKFDLNTLKDLGLNSQTMLKINFD